MKCQKTLALTFVVLSFICLFCSIPISAADDSLDTIEMSPEEQEYFLNTVQLAFSTDSIQKQPFVCFDVREDGWIALGFHGNSKKQIGVYNSQGEYQYGYSFICSGSYYVKWDMDNLNIYFVRSDVAISIEGSHDSFKVAQIADTPENNDIWNHKIRSTKRESQCASYRAENDMGMLNLFAGSYAFLIRVDASGAETVLFDANQEQIAKTCCIFAMIIILFCFVLGRILLSFGKKRRNAD